MAPQRGLARLLRRQVAGGRVVLHELDPPPGFAGSYRHPGQYVLVRAGGSDTYFVLGGEPGAPHWELFVQPGGDVADAIVALDIGGNLDVSTALGDGFPVASVAERRLFVVATGSGIAAVRPVLNDRVRRGLASLTEVFFGVRAPEELPLEDDMLAWTADGLVITVCVSRVAPRADGHFRGYVQDALRERASREPSSFRGAAIFAAGGSAMIDAVRTLATTLGVSETDVRTNY